MKTTREMDDLFGTSKPIIGMLHLDPLPGSPIYNGEGLDNVIEAVLKEAELLVKGGVNGLEVENFKDPSYDPNTAPAETIASIAVIANEIRKQFVDIPFGVCLLADPIASIAVAHVTKCEFVRATFFTEAAIDVSGIAVRNPHQILRYRKFLDPSIKIFADIHIKHSAPLGQRPIEESAYDAAYFLADAVILSGKHTGFETPLEDVKKVKSVLPDFPVFIGSGTSLKNAEGLLKYADGAIVGTAFKMEGKSENNVESKRVIKFMDKVAEVRKNS